MRYHLWRSGRCVELVQHRATWCHLSQPSGTQHLGQLSLRGALWKRMRSSACHDMSMSCAGCQNLI